MPRTHNRWTSEELEILRKYYPMEGSEVSNRVNHSPASCRTRAGLIGLHFYETKGGKISWTEEEDDIIRTYYPTHGSSITKRLPGKSKSAVVARAIRLGVQHNKYKQD